MTFMGKHNTNHVNYVNILLASHVAMETKVWWKQMRWTWNQKLWLPCSHDNTTNGVFYIFTMARCFRDWPFVYRAQKVLHLSKYLCLCVCIFGISRRIGIFFVPVAGRSSDFRHKVDPFSCCQFCCVTYSNWNSKLSTQVHQSVGDWF